MTGIYNMNANWVERVKEDVVCREMKEEKDVMNENGIMRSQPERQGVKTEQGNIGIIQWEKGPGLTGGVRRYSTQL